MINKASRVLSEAVDTALDTLLRSTSIHSFEWKNLVLWIVYRRFRLSM